jgi:hypothetical protein
LRTRLRNRLLQPVEERTFAFVFSEEGEHECQRGMRPTDDSNPEFSREVRSRRNGLIVLSPE